MKILVDASVAYGETVFEDLGELRIKPAWSIVSSDLVWANALICRSQVQVNETLLADNNLLFVGTPTAGLNHLDQAFLKERGIGYAHAPGCNAQSVVDYVLAAICLWVLSKKRTLLDVSVGIVGCGHIGSLLLRRLENMGVSTKVSDPPVEAAQKEGSCEFSSLSEVFRSDLVCLHTPLSTTGQWPTQNLVRSSLLNLMPGESLLLSCGRGGVVNEGELIEWSSAAGHQALIDVWQNEPAINQKLLASAWIATPHIAGYSLDGRVAGSLMVRSGLLKLLNRPEQTAPFVADLTAPPAINIKVSSLEEAMKLTVRLSGLKEDDTLFRKQQQQAAEPALAFEQTRKNYRHRRDFSQITLAGARGAGADLLSALGFQIA